MSMFLGALNVFGNVYVVALVVVKYSLFCLDVYKPFSFWRSVIRMCGWIV
jgi:hypothetical protein